GEAELLQRAVDEPALEHFALDERPRLGGALVQRERILGRHVRHSLAAFRPPRPSDGSSEWPTPQVLITRCCPYVSATNPPSSTISSSLKCSRSLSQSASSTPSGFQTRLLVNRSAAFCRSVNVVERSNSSSSP